MQQLMLCGGIARPDFAAASALRSRVPRAVFALSHLEDGYRFNKLQTLHFQLFRIFCRTLSCIEYHRTQLTMFVMRARRSGCGGNSPG